MKNFAHTYAQFVNYKDQVDEFVASPEFKDGLAAYSEFMLSDEASLLLRHRDRYETGVLQASGWQLGRWSSADDINLTQYIHQDDVSVSVPVAWFTDNEKFRQDTLAKAAAKREEQRIRTEQDNAAAAEGRREEFQRLGAEFAPTSDDKEA